MKTKQRILSVFMCLVIVASMLIAPPTAYAGIFDTNNISANKIIQSWINKNSSLSTNAWLNTVNNAQKYYTNVTSSTVGSSGNITNYYRSGDTTNTKIIDSYNKMFNIINSNNHKEAGDVTNVYYYELEDGRNSSTLTASEIAGIDLKYDVKNYNLITDDPNTLSLQRFDGAIPTVPVIAEVPREHEPGRIFIQIMATI